jgi:Arc/MetJ family transcription regulator
MATNLAIDDRLIEQAVKLSGHRTKKAAVTEALREYIHRRQQARIVRLFGKIDIDKTYDYKRARKQS